jgi:hypothetical protein
MSYKIYYLVIQVIYYLLSSEIISDIRNKCKINEKRLFLDRDDAHKMSTNITGMKTVFCKGKKLTL